MLSCKVNLQYDSILSVFKQNTWHALENMVSPYLKYCDGLLIEKLPTELIMPGGSLLFYERNSVQNMPSMYLTLFFPNSSTPPL